MNDVSFQWKTLFLRSQPGKNPKPMVNKFGTSADHPTPREVTQFIVIASEVLSVQEDEVAAFVIFFFFQISSSRPQPNALADLDD